MTTLRKATSAVFTQWWESFISGCCKRTWKF